MLTNGFSGFPMLDGIPRGETFVQFMRMESSDAASSSPATAGPSTAPVGLKPGNFDRNADSKIVSQDSTDLGNGSKQLDFTREYSDGSVRKATRVTFPDGTGKETGERRSLPDANGNQLVRVFDIDIAADGTRNVDVRIFRVPAGTTLDWDSAAAQASLVETVFKSIPPGMTWQDVPEQAVPLEQPPERPPEQEPTHAVSRPVIPLPT